MPLSKLIITNLGWALIILLTLIPVVRWFQLNGFEDFEDSYGAFTALGSITGIIAMVLFALNFVLSTRLKLFDTIFGGLNKAYISHHIIGGLALIIMLMHPFFLAVRHLPESFQYAALFLLPSFAPNADWAENFGAFALYLTVILLVITFYVKLPYQKWLNTHRFLGLALLLAGIHVFLIPSDTYDDVFLRVYMLSIVAIGLAAFVYHTILGRILIRHSHMLVQNVEQLNNKVVRITLTPTSQHSVINFTPGQFVFVRFKSEGIKYEYHPFSITSREGDISITVIVKALGDFTASLKNLEIGSSAEVEGAFGSFGKNLKLGNQQTWIAGGIGITPFLSLAKSLKGDESVELFYVVETPQDLVEFQELNAVSKLLGENFTLKLYPTNIHEKFISGEYIINNSSSDLKTRQVLICGPPPMMKSMRAQLKAAGVRNSNIHTEEFALQ